MFQKPIQFDPITKKSGCDVCGCSLMMLLPTPLEHNKASVESEAQNASRPESCWLRKNGVNFKPDAK